MRVALVTCAEVADLDPDDRLVVAPLAARGVHAEPAIWDAGDMDWSAFDLAVLRSTWDYPRCREPFLTWARGVPALANPADVVEWNTDKRYLAELIAAGLPVVPTTWLAPGESWPPPQPREYVIKPSVGAGSLDTDLSDEGDRGRAQAHVSRLQAAGRDVMVQPYLSGVDHRGETALLYLGGEYSHAVRKGSMLTNADQVAYSLYRPEEITPRKATAAERAVAERVLAAVPGGPDRLLYARVDLISGQEGETPVLLELELTEPSLYLGHADDAPSRFAGAIVSWL
jgi:glutathione synthase/RimK-type ligase-like ATP-grasp enzyme